MSLRHLGTKGTAHIDRDQQYDTDQIGPDEVNHKQRLIHFDPQPFGPAFQLVEKGEGHRFWLVVEEMNYGNYGKTRPDKG